MQSGLKLAAWLLIVFQLHGISDGNIYARYRNAARISPQDKALRVGSNLTAVCHLREKALGLTAAGLRWVLNATPLGGRAVRVLDASRSEVTLTALGPSLPSGHNLLCISNEDHDDLLLAGSVVYVGEPPSAPTELRCHSWLSENMTCTWEPSGETHIRTTYSLHYRLIDDTDAQCADYATGGPNSCFFKRENLYLFVTYNVWVVARNMLGSATSAELSVNPMDIAQPPPPANIVAVGLSKYPKHLDVSWSYPSCADLSFYPLQFQLRHRRHGTAADWQTVEVGTQVMYALYELRPGTRHEVQLRCRHSEGRGHWSDWSPTVTARTAPALKRNHLQLTLEQRKQLMKIRSSKKGKGQKGRKGRKQPALEGR